MRKNKRENFHLNIRHVCSENIRESTYITLQNDQEFNHKRICTDASKSRHARVYNVIQSTVPRARLV